MYNLTNPLDYLQNGSEAVFHEVGGYSYDVEVSRANARFSDGKVKFSLFTSGTFNSGSSPSDLDSSDEVFVVNAAYSTFIGKARSEAVMMLSSTCGVVQLALIGNSGVPLCRTEEINTATMCQCCSPTPVENSTTCGDITASTSAAGGLLSYLAMNDGGIQLDSNPSAYPFSSGAYSALVVKKSVDELVLGAPSSMLGLFSYQGGTDFDKASVSNTTQDMADACGALGYCPTLSELLVQFGGAGGNLNVILGIIKGLDCSGVIPDTAGLIDAGLTEERALELRYLKGNNCRPYTPTLAIAGVVAATSAMGSSYTCAADGATLPCCLSAFSVPGMFSGSGQGCIAWVPGVVVTRQTYSLDEAYRYLTPSPDSEVINEILNLQRFSQSSALLKS